MSESWKNDGSKIGKIGAKIDLKMTKNIYTNGPKMVQKWSKIKRYRVSNITYRPKNGLF